jgi:hypothetical protein
MKLSEFRKLIREEVRKVVNEDTIKMSYVNTDKTFNSPSLKKTINLTPESFAAELEKIGYKLGVDFEYGKKGFKSDALPYLMIKNKKMLSNAKSKALIDDMYDKTLDKPVSKLNTPYKTGNSVKDWEGNSIGKVLYAFNNGIDLEQALMKDKALKASIKWSLSSAKSLSDYLDQYEDVNRRQPHYIIKDGSKVYVVPQEDLK